MKRLVITAGIAVAAAVPAALGLIGNASFAQSVPVHVPERATLLDDRGSAIPTTAPTTLTVTADDHGGLRSSLSSSAPSTRTPSSVSSTVPTASDDGRRGPGSGHDGSADDSATTTARHAETGDDNGGLRSAPESEPGDDRGGLPSSQDAADDSGRHGVSNNDDNTTSSSNNNSGSNNTGSNGRGGDDGAGHS